jgi:hypothetical protein
LAKIECEIEEVLLENDHGLEIESIRATCSKCGHIVESFGTSGRSVKRCLVLMKEECPEGEENYYVDQEGDWP